MQLLFLIAWSQALAGAAEFGRVAVSGGRPIHSARGEVREMGKWSSKDERQYEHIKESSKDRGKSTKRAKEIAARTVNKQRREEGRTPSKTTSGTGNPRKSLEDRSKQELYNKARQMGIEGRSKMNKSDLVKAIQKQQ